MDWRGLATAGNLLGLGYLAFIGSAVCYVAWNSSVERLGVRKTNLYIYVIPLVTLVAGALLLHERVTLMEDGVNVFFIQRILGHATLWTTMRYLRITQTDVLKTKSPLDKLMEKEEKRKTKGQQVTTDA